jgi:nitroimidazol reductase NimA-like FMN-containing flavoprotein (pyridoxamine 5'-phosphate oxidase superfamily)
MLKALASGAAACVTATLLDGLVLARSAFHHSMNYRSVMILGSAREVTEPAEKRRALEAVVEHVMAGRAAAVRAPSVPELNATIVLAVPITEASAKIRTGPPLDAEPDYALQCWAGVLPLRLAALPPLPDPRLPPGIAPPPELTCWSRGGAPRG